MQLSACSYQDAVKSRLQGLSLQSKADFSMQSKAGFSMQSKTGFSMQSKAGFSMQSKAYSQTIAARGQNM